MAKKEAVNHPKHYNMYKGLEIIDLVEQMNFNRGNAVKYIARAGFKGDHTQEIEDLQKALWYVTREIERVANSLEKVESLTPYVRTVEAKEAEQTHAGLPDEIKNAYLEQARTLFVDEVVRALDQVPSPRVRERMAQWFFERTVPTPITVACLEFVAEHVTMDMDLCEEEGLPAVVLGDDVATGRYNSEKRCYEWIVSQEIFLDATLVAAIKEVPSCDHRLHLLEWFESFAIKIEYALLCVKFFDVHHVKVTHICDVDSRGAPIVCTDDPNLRGVLNKRCSKYVWEETVPPDFNS